MKKIIWVLIVNFIWVNYAEGQQEIDKLIPASPQARELMQSIEYPVSFSTGAANINIPLKSISIGSLTLPISISYNSRGFKKNEKEGVVGLGWSLDSSLEITREIRGLDDFTYERLSIFGYYHFNEGHRFYQNGCDQPHSNLDSQTSFNCAFKKAYDIDFLQRLDYMPDKFYYKLLNGKSGAFYFKNNRSETPDSSHTYEFTRTIIQWPYTGVKIEIIETPDCDSDMVGEFKITDVDGTEYFYGRYYVDESMLTTVNPESSDVLMPPCIVDKELKRNITSWKCFKIISPIKKEEILFSFEPNEEMFSFSFDDHIKVFSEKIFHYPNAVPYYGVSTEDDIFEESIPFFVDPNISNYALSDGSYQAIIVDKPSIKYAAGYLNYPIHYTINSNYYNSATVFPTKEDDIVILDRDIGNWETLRKQKRQRLKQIIFLMVLLILPYDRSGLKNGQLSTIEISNQNQITDKFVFHQNVTGDDSEPQIFNDRLYEYDGSTNYLDSLSIETSNNNLTYTFTYNNKNRFTNYPTSTINGHRYLDINDLAIRAPELGSYRFFTIGKDFKRIGNPFMYLSSIYPNNSNDRLTNEGLLSSITYPSGGTTYFYYEPNEAYAFNSNKVENVEAYRIQSITSHNSEGDWLERRFKYGRYETGGGVKKPLRFSHADFYEENVISASMSQMDVLATDLDFMDNPDYYYLDFTPTNFYTTVDRKLLLLL